MKNNLFQIFKNCFEFANENRDFKYSHISLYLYLVNICNKLHWDSNFGVPTEVTLHVLSMGYKNYKKCLSELESFGAIKIVELSSNQYTSLLIDLNLSFSPASVKCPKHDQSMTKARPKLDQHNNTINTINTNKDYIYKGECFEFYKNFYFQKFKSPYIESKNEFDSLNSLLKKLDQYQKSIKDQRRLSDFFQLFIENVWLLNIEYFLNNFTLSVLDSKFNDLINQLRNNKGKSRDSVTKVYIKPNFWQPRDNIN